MFGFGIVICCPGLFFDGLPRAFPYYEAQKKEATLSNFLYNINRNFF
jgi:hypothetical protein